MEPNSQDLSPNTPPQTETPSPTHRRVPVWAEFLLVGIGVACVLGAALWVGNKYYFQKTPLPPPPVATSTEETPSQNQNGANTPLPSETSAETAAFYTTLNTAVFEEQYCSFSELCSAVKTQGGISAIRFPRMITPPSPLSYGAYTGAGVLTVGGVDTVLLFNLSTTGTPTLMPTELVTPEEILHITALTNAVAPLSDDEPGGTPVIQITGTTADGTSATQLLGPDTRRNYSNALHVPLVVNADGSISNIVTNSNSNLPKITFHIPYINGLENGYGYVYGSAADRDLGMELPSKLGVSVRPIYHKASCGLEETYSDVAFSAYALGTTIAINAGLAPTLNITTAMSGYVPSEWGKILTTVSMREFINTIKSTKAPNSNAPVDMIDLDGYQIKHTGPIAYDRSCGEDVTADMYQTTKDGAVITITVTQGGNNANRATQEQIFAMFREIFRTLKIAPRS